MGKKEKAAKKSQRVETRWSARSQKSLIKEHRLNANLARLRGMIERAKRTIANLDKECTDIAKAAIVQGPVLNSRLDDRLRKLEAEKRLMAAYENQAGNLEKEVAELQPSAAQLAETAKNQARMAETVQARLATDSRLAEMIGGLFSLLTEREEQSGTLQELAQSIDLTLQFDSLDLERFKALRDALPGDLLKKSRAWVNWFLGEPRETATYTATEETTLPETLANANFFTLGQSMRLTATEAAEVFPKKTEAQEFREWQESRAAKPAPGAGLLTEIDKWYAENAPRAH